MTKSAGAGPDPDGGAETEAPPKRKGLAVRHFGRTLAVPREKAKAEAPRSLTGWVIMLSKTAAAWLGSSIDDDREARAK